MAPLSLRIVQDNGTVTKKVKLDPALTVREALAIVKEKTHVKENAEWYGLFLRAAEHDLSGAWLEERRALRYYGLRDGDRLDYMTRIRTLRVKMLDDSVKTLQVDQSKLVCDLMITICSRLGITNHEEYGLCLDKEEEAMEMEKAGHSGTLTMQKKSKLKDQDLQLEQRSKKLKTDDNVEWLDGRGTLSEARVAPQRAVLLRRRLYYSDRTVDARDPVQLNLLYVQARDDVLDARHPVTEDMAAEFAGIQCQVHYGDFQEDKHKPGFIENMKEFMPEQYASAWGIEKKILKEYKKHQGLSALEAKNVYTRTARALPTYGVTFFLVKEKQKDKKKLVPRLLGISAQSILRLDERSKEILQQWPLTHVKTYHAAKGEIFTLNFGDYSEKEYSVKTLDAYRIRDILEDYIDLIRKRMLAAYNSTRPDDAYITSDTISSSQANVVQHVSNDPMKVVEQCFVGPSQIVTHEIGKDMCHGTQIVTVQQVIVSGKGDQHQRAAIGEVGMRGDMSIPFTRRLNRLNSNSVKIVTLLTVPSNRHMEDARKIVEAMNEDLAYVRDGVQETISKQTSDEDKKKLQNQMNELDELMKALTECSGPDKTDSSEVGDAAMQVADLTTQMYFSLDAKLKRRSKIISRSRPSFVEDEQSRRALRKASFIACVAGAARALQGAGATLQQDYSGPPLDSQRSVAIEAAAVDHLGKLNAAIAHYILAHSDPKDVDYEAAVTSMNTIHELMPEFCKDAQALASCRDPPAKKLILLDAKAICEATNKICSSTGMEDREKLHEASREYAEASGRLVFTFCKGRNSEKENEMLELADAAVAQTSQLLLSAQQLTQLAPQEPPAAAVDAAGVTAADAAKDLISQVQLCAATISEPHCQSAVTAAAEALAAAAQQLAVSARPLLEQPERRARGDHMHHQLMQLAKALDKLKGAYGGLGGYDEGDVFEDPAASQEQRRLQFITSVSRSHTQWNRAEELLTEAAPAHVREAEWSAAQARLARRLGHLNAAVAALLAATADRDRPDYVTAELAINTINELMPQVIQDTKMVSANKDEEARKAMMEHIKALCDASKGICTGSEDSTPESRGEAIAKFTNASGKLVFGISHRGNPDRETQILELSEAACRRARQLAAGARQAAEAAGGARGEELDARGRSCAHAADALHAAAQVTAPSISEPRCQAALLAAIDKLSSSSQELASAWKPLHDHAMHKRLVQGLEQTLEQLEDKLDALRGACISSNGVQQVEMTREQQKLQFGRTMAATNERILKAQKTLDEPILPTQSGESTAGAPHKLSGRLGELNAAIAALLSATSDRDNTDYKTAEQAVRTITDLIPHVVQDTKSMCASKDEATRAAMLDLIKELCEASRAVCAGADGTNKQGLSDAVAKFSDASGKLVYVVNPRVNTEREKQIDDQSASACSKVSQLLSGVQQLSEAVGGARGQELDCRGAAVADAAQTLLATSQVTAPSISEPHCNEALLSSIDKLSSSGRALAESWQPMLQEPQRRQQAAALQASLQQLETQLEALRKTCQIPDKSPEEDEHKFHELENEQKVQFGRRMSLVTEQIQRAQKALDKPPPPPLSADKAEAVQQRLSGRLGELNAAIAALLAATSDRDNTDYKTAEQAVRTITDLVPHVVQDTQSTCANKDEVTRAAMLDLIRELCEASRAVCAGADGTNPRGLSDAVAKFSDASGKLVYVVNPRVNTEREKQIDDQSASACSKVSQLLSGVQQLSEAVGGARGQELDCRGAAVADAAQTLLATSQVTAPSISEPHCKEALLSSIDKLSSSGRALAESWQPMLQEPQRRQQAAALQASLQQLETQLEALRKTCQIPDGVPQTTELPRELQKLQFVKTMSGAKEHIQKAQMALDKPIPPPQSTDKAEAVQQSLSGRLGELNAAIAALLGATADTEKPDYKTAEEAMKNITQLMPHVVQDTQSTCANKDEATRAAMLDLIKELCEASRAVCAGADGTNKQGLSDAVAKFSDASGKLVYVVNPRVNTEREKQIDDQSASACSKVSQLLSGVQQLSEAVGGARGQELDCRGAAVADAAQTLLATSQVTAPSISEPHCKEALLSSIDKLSSSGRALAESWQPMLQEPQRRQQAAALQASLQQLETQLEALRKTCQIPDGDGKAKKTNPHEPQKLQFVTSMEQAKEQIRNARKALDKPIPPPQSSDKAEVVQKRLSGRLGQLNAAIASLLSATANREKPYYQIADTAVKTIVDLLPHVIQDTQSACANASPASRAAMLDLVTQLSAASEAVCAGADGTNPQGLSEAVGKFSDASGELVYLLSPQDKHAADQLVQLAVAACRQSSQMLSSVQRVSRAADAARARSLDAAGAALADAAQALLACAQVTAPSISEPHCKAALLDSADLLSSYSEDLAKCWQPLLQEPKHQKQVTELQQLLPSLEAQIEALRKACAQPMKVPLPPARVASRAPPSGVAGGLPASSSENAHAATEEFLHRMRSEEGQGHSPPAAPRPPTVMTDDEKRHQQLFMQAVDDAHRTIKHAKDECGGTDARAALSAGAGAARRARLQRGIARACVEVAALLAANYGHTVDYPAASKAMKALPELVSNIVADGQDLSSSVNCQESRKAFLNDMLEMCDSTLKICDAAKNDREKLNDAAVEFGDKSAKLLYVVSNDVDASLEKEIISRAKAIGDGVAQISVRSGGVCGAARARARGGCAPAAAADALCAAGARCQDGAGKLLYTAKLVAPSIYETPCQEALYQSADSLTAELRTFTDSWKPFSTDPQHADTIKELRKDADNLERILEGLKSDVKGGRIGLRKEMEKLVVEDTPMRQLTLRIIEDAMSQSSSAALPAARRRAHAEHCARLRRALPALDLAHARCKRTPHDTSKRRELEDAVQNLQIAVLQSRPRRADRDQTNIVDLRDFITEVTSEADKLEEEASSLKVATAADKKALQEIIGYSQKMSKAAYTLTHSDDVSGFDTTFDNILDVDQFGQECDDVITDINAQLQRIEDEKARNALYAKMLPLTESCNMLRFATKSGISTAKSVTLDATLDDLDDVEERVISAIVKEEAETDQVTLRPARARPLSPSTSAALARCACDAARSPRAPLAAYVAACAASAASADRTNRNRLLQHLYKLVHLLRSRAAASSRLVATWQPVDHHPELSALTHQILQEIENPESQFLPESEKIKKILNESDLTKLLIPSPAKVVGDVKHQEEKLSQLATKLSSMSSALTLGIASPDALSRSAHATAAAAVELSAVARGCCNKKDPVHCSRLEEAVQEMTFTTYGFLKRAERACLEGGAGAGSRRRLRDATLQLNAAIDALMSVASSVSEVKKACGSMQRALLVQETAPVPGTAPYEQCCEALHQHQEAVYKMKSDQPMSRGEFARSLGEVNGAVCKTTQISSQCAYLISVSENDSDIAKKGPVDVPQIQKCIEALQDSCMAIIGSSTVHQAEEESEDLYQRIQDFSRAIDEAQLKVKDADAKATLSEAKASVAASATSMWHSLKEDNDMSVLSPAAVCLLGRVMRAHAAIERGALAPPPPRVSADTRGRCDELTNNSKTLLHHTLALVKEVNSSEEDGEVMTWVTFSTSKKKLLDAYDALVKSIRVNGQRAGILEGTPEDEMDDPDFQHKTYLEKQVDLANKWLNRPMCSAEVKTTGQQAVGNVVDIATKISEELKGNEREEMRSIIIETEELLAQCALRYDSEKYSVLSDQVKELKKAIQRGVVTRVVEDFIEVDDAGALDVMLDSEEDDQKRKFLLERKIAELLAQVARVSRTARLAAAAAGPSAPAAPLARSTHQTELLAPMLVQAAQDRIASPNDQTVIEKYARLLAQFAQRVREVRALCDAAVDPMDFVQAAGDTMQRMRDESSSQNDIQKGQRTSEAIIKLANRSIEVSMSSLAVRRDPSLRTALLAAQRRVLAATPAQHARASTLPDWKESTAEVLRTTGEVESALGGENIFKEQPTAHTTNQQIYCTARALHASVREWSARDNDIVAAARRVAVLMARLAECMHTDKKQSLISASKSIVSESHEVALLARKLAHECTDVRIKTNLLQTCERIPTISAQLKMLTTVKGSSLGHQGSKEDSEAMDMLVGNAQSLMMSIQEVVKAAAGASVKIMSQRGPRLRWVRKNYY